MAALAHSLIETRYEQMFPGALHAFLANANQTAPSASIPGGSYGT
jgi:hypothetical protein